MLHQHGEVLRPYDGHRVYARDLQSSSAPDSSLPCVVCQIVQNGAVQVGIAAKVLRLFVSVPLDRGATARIYRSELPAMTYGRAPPLK